MKLVKIIENRKLLSEFITKDIKLPYNVSRAVVKNYKTLNEEVELFDEHRKRMAIGFVEKTQEEQDAINNELIKMADAEIDIDIILIDEKDISSVELSAKDLLTLDFMLKGDVDNEQ